jgi:hypothetical protein
VGGHLRHAPRAAPRADLRQIPQCPELVQSKGRVLPKGGVTMRATSGKLSRPVRAWELLHGSSQDGARASLAAGWLVSGPLPELHRTRFESRSPESGRSFGTRHLRERSWASRQAASPAALSFRTG